MICAMDAIAPGAARAFDLAESDGQGGARPFRIVIARNKAGQYFSPIAMPARTRACG